MDEAHKIELRKLDLEIVHKQIEVKNLNVNNESEVDRGMDFLAS